MVIDFEEIKRQVKTFIEQTLDHQMILFEKDPLVPLLRQAGESIVVFAQNPTAENLAQFIFEEVQKKGLPVVSVRLWETSSASAEYKS